MGFQHTLAVPIDRRLHYFSRAFCSELGNICVESKYWNLRNLVLSNANTIDILGLQVLLQRSAKRKSLVTGKVCHGLAIHAGLLTDILTCNILVNLYSKCDEVDSARRVFDRMPVRSTVSWNTMIAGYNQHGEDIEALKLFSKMHVEGAAMTEFTLSSILCASAAKCYIAECKQLHALALKSAMNSNLFVGTALLDVYAKCNMIDDAFWIFDNMPQKTSVTWSSMVAGCVQNDLHEEALGLFRRAQQERAQLTQFTLSAALSACASLALMIEGSQLHAVLVKAGFHSNIFVATSILNVYSRCGEVEKAYLVFADTEEKNITLWNAMIAGFSKHARSWEATILFEKMMFKFGLSPNEVTYVSVLSACSHAGFVGKGRCYFHQLMNDKNVLPNVLHYSCMIDVLGRAGQIDEAWELIRKMPFKATASMWGSLLGSCRNHRNLKFAKIAAEQLVQLEPHNGGNYVLLSDAYAANKNWDGVVATRKLLKNSGAKKEIGKSWIEVKGKIHTFIVGERNNSKITNIYAKLEDLAIEMRKLDYKVNTKFDLHDVPENEKEELLRHHSEKLALAFGLISLPADVPIRIFNSLRVCGDCHSFLNLASRISRRVIIIRDIKRFHHFRDGSCSCGDFW